MIAKNAILNLVKKGEHYKKYAQEEVKEAILHEKIINRILDSYLKYDLKNGVNFEELSYENVLQASSKSGKLVFIDFYTDWCGPCKAMTQDVFPTEVVGKYFNTNLHAIKINAEKGDGVSISKKYKINAYPTMLVVDASGKEVGRIVGYKTPRELIGELEKITK